MTSISKQDFHHFRGFFSFHKKKEGILTLRKKEEKGRQGKVTF
jgi:hypothetical protein